VLLNATEVRHEVALSRWLELMRQSQQIVLTDWVIAETGNGLARSRTKPQFDSVVQQMMDAPSVELVYVGRELLQRALSMYVQHKDKSWGLVDCASFVVMRDRGILDAFTTDAHFEQAGFRRLLSV
jgi:predicted nucleic acid-binding protein